MNAASDIGNAFKTLLSQKCRDLHAAPTMMTQTSDGSGAVKLLQPRRNQTHGNVQKIKPRWFDASRLQFPGFTNIQDQQGPAIGVQVAPLGQLVGGDLVNHRGWSRLEMKARGLRKVLQSGGGAVPKMHAAELSLTQTCVEGGLHDGVFADDGQQTAPHLQLVK